MNECFYSGAFRSVKWHIAYYWDIKKAVTDRRLELKKRSGTAERRSEGFISNPTEKEAEINLSKLPCVYLSLGKVEKPEEWIEAIDYVMDRLGREDRKLIHASFWGHNNWRAAVTELNMDKMTYYKRRDHLIAVFAIHCAERGLIHI